MKAWDTQLVQVGDREVPRYALLGGEPPQVDFVEHFRARVHGRVTDVVALGARNSLDSAILVYDSAACSEQDQYVRRHGFQLAFHRAQGALQQADRGCLEGFLREGPRYRGFMVLKVAGEAGRLSGVALRDKVRAALQEGGVPLPNRSQRG